MDSKNISLRGMNKQEKFKTICEIALDKFQLFPLRYTRYKNMDTYMHFVDIEGKMFNTTPYNIIRKNKNTKFSLFRYNIFTKYNLCVLAENKFNLKFYGDIEKYEYEGWDSVLDFIDNEGYIYQIVASRLNQCEIGYRFDKYVNNKHAIKNINNYIIKYNIIITDKKFTKVTDSYNMVNLKNGYKYYTSPNRMLNKDMIPNAFGKSNIYSIYNIRKYLKNNNANCKLLSNEYICSDEFLLWECKLCGSKYKRAWDKQYKSLKNTKGNGECIDCVNIRMTGSYNIKNSIKNKKDFLKIKSKLYFISINTNNDSFKKIGITIINTESRIDMISLDIKYYNIINEKELDLYTSIFLETYLHDYFKQKQYIPQEKFSGYTECFKNITKSDFDKQVKYFISNKDKIISNLTEQYS